MTGFCSEPEGLRTLRLEILKSACKTLECLKVVTAEALCDPLHIVLLTAAGCTVSCMILVLMTLHRHIQLAPGSCLPARG